MIIERLYGHLDVNGHQLLRQRFEQVEVLPAEGLEGQPVHLTTNNRAYLWSSGTWRQIETLTVAANRQGELELTAILGNETAYRITLQGQLSTSQRLLQTPNSLGATVPTGFGIGCDPTTTFDTVGTEWRRRSLPGEVPQSHTQVFHGGKPYAAGAPFLRLTPPNRSSFFGYANITVIERANTQLFHHVIGTVMITELGAQVLHSMSATYRAISSSGNRITWMDTTPVMPTRAPIPAALSADSFIIVEQYALYDEATVEFL